MARKTLQQQVRGEDAEAVASLCADVAPSLPAPQSKARSPSTTTTARPSRAAKKRDVLPLPGSRGPGKKARGDQRDVSLSDYLTSLGRIPLLSADDEVRLAASLREAELLCWTDLLRVRSCVDAVASSSLCAEHAVLSTKVQALLQAMTPPQETAPSLAAELSELVGALAALLRELDDDRVVVDIALAAAKAAVAAGEERPETVERVQSNRRRALAVRNTFVRANLRLVVSVARRFHHHRLPLVDLIQEGNLGLIKSVHRFDHRRGFRFSTYAHWWIRQAIERSIMNKGAQVRLPVHVFDSRRELARVTRDLTHALGREPGIEELASSLGMTLDKVYELMAAVPREPQSLDEPLGDDEDRTLADAIAAGGPGPDELVIQQCEERGVKGLLGRLSPMEMDIIRRRFGLGNDDDETLEEIGRSYRLSRERVRQIQVQGLRKLQERLSASAFVDEATLS
jgi:RNA polymerase primary sigma factor